MSNKRDNNSSGCCCGLCSALFSTLCSIGFAILIYWAIFQPHHIRATVDSATLTNLTVTNGTVSYHLSLSLDLYNPSVRVGIYYDALDSELGFGGTVLGAANDTSPAKFYQHRKTGDTVKFEFDGRGASVPEEVAGELAKEIGEGSVSLEVAVDGQVRYKFNVVRIRVKPKIWCSLTIPVKPEGRGVGGAVASGERCNVKY